MISGPHGEATKCSPLEQDALGCLVSIAYDGLGAFAAPMELQNVKLQNHGFAASQTVNLSGSFDVAFMYDTLFTAGFYMRGHTQETGGSFDFLNTAKITSVILPAGAVLTGSSGANYPTVQMTPVPEPATLLLVSSGAAAFGLRRRLPRRPF